MEGLDGRESTFGEISVPAGDVVEEVVIVILGVVLPRGFTVCIFAVASVHSQSINIIDRPRYPTPD